MILITAAKVGRTEISIIIFIFHLHFESVFILNIHMI